MFYNIRHLTRFRYSTPVRESLMELRMHPRSEGPQRCLGFEVTVSPRTRLQSYRDYLGNVVHHFDVPGPHRQLTITAEAMVDVESIPAPPERIDGDAWSLLDSDIAARDFWEMLTPSQFTQWTPAIDEFARELKLPIGREARSRDPLGLLRETNSTLYHAIEYVPKSTRVDSPVDDALRSRRGVCQDFSHIAIALVRRMGIPCRYVSGYLFHRKNTARSPEGATHAWIEAYLPVLGWTGFDPTNNIAAGDTHVRTAVGRDYADVPPTRGVFKGDASSELTVAVRVSPSDRPPPPEAEAAPEDWSQALAADSEGAQAAQEQQQQQ
ncbi:MAG TPA: transglutaminase family protein [Verrucomicrobiae bacterium]|nr:transglutaminase family protein [Verrucomicrobiae bacterium]